MMQDSEVGQSPNSQALFDQAYLGRLPEVRRMPTPSVHLRVRMRDGVGLDTWVWLPLTAEPVPAILKRTPYQEHVLGWRPESLQTYLDAGYALVYQQIRGTGTSEGSFVHHTRAEAVDGYDAVEWIAEQQWCDGAVGMDGSSYLGLTQLWAATERPPHLRCIIPAAPSLTPFQGGPYFGGAFSRQHTINWTRLISISDLRELTGGFEGAMPILAQPDWLHRMTSRPVLDAADDILQGDRLEHYRQSLEHPVLDSWWQDRTIQPRDYARIEVPVLLVTGNFDDSVSETLRGWRDLEENRNGDPSFHLLIGPWDHGQTYTGGASQYGPYQFGAIALDLVDCRIRFFDQHLKGVGDGPRLSGRVTVFITGANVWRSFSAYPPEESTERALYLHSGGSANSARGDGRLDTDKPEGAEPPDSFVSDPELPFVPALSSADPALSFDVRELERCFERLVYSTGPLQESLTIVGEPLAVLHISADVPDCDVVVWLAEQRSDGTSVLLALGMLRMRYRQGFNRQVLMTPGAPVKVEIPLRYVSHEVPVGSRLRLLIGGDLFPFLDPNPNTGEPIATAVDMRTATETVHHDVNRPSLLLLPTLPVPSAAEAS